MKTILRSYHPLACVQRNDNTRRHMQDAPRMKSLLKSVLLDGETPGPAGSASGVGSGGNNPGANAAKAAAAAVIAATAGSSSGGSGGSGVELGDAPGTLSDLLAKRRKFAGSRHPVTSIVTLFFILTAQANDITMLHFAAPHDFWTIFFPHTRYPVPARQRAKSFLWLIWHYLEGPIDAVTSDGPANPFDDAASAAAMKDARATRASITTEPERKRAYWEGAWRGVRNPEWEDWNKKRKAAAAAAASSATADGPPAAKKQRRSPDSAAPAAVDGDGDAQMADASTSAVKKSEEEEKAPGAEEELAPPEFLHRILSPHLDVISIPESAAENVDTDDERSWAQEMRDERTAFLVRFQAEEGARLAGLDPSKVDLDGASVRGTPDVGGESIPAGSAAAAMVAAAATAASKGKQKPGGKRTALPMGGGSSYPLANILAAAKDANGLTTGPGSVAGSVGVFDPEAARLEAEEAARRERAERAPPNLWQLNLRVPAAPNGAARNRNMSSAAHFAAQAASLSLPRIAWRRILERARRGVGEASYESDDDEVAEDEARDGEPRQQMPAYAASS
jgi:Ino eighty subunit 1